MIAWVYGSGFPKSLDVSKAIESNITNGKSNSRSLRATEQAGDGEPYTLRGKNNGIMGETRDFDRKRFTPATPEAEQWQGWGTALKPAMEPITMARKPLAGTVAVNVLAHGTGGINIDGCRVETGDVLTHGGPLRTNSGDGRTGKALGMFQDGTPNTYKQNEKGRFPANLIHDGSEEVVGLFPNAGNGHWSYKPAKDGGIYKYGLKDMPDGGSDKTVSSAARFFYCAKASRSERNAGLEGMPEKRPDERTNTGMGTFVEKGVAKQSNHHPTVKPIELMRYLVRLVTPPGGIVLDPFAGSGSTGVACAEEGFGFIGIEREAEYCEIARARIENRGGLFCTSNAVVSLSHPKGNHE